MTREGGRAASTLRFFLLLPGRLCSLCGPFLACSAQRRSLFIKGMHGKGNTRNGMGFLVVVVFVWFFGAENMAGRQGVF